MNNEQHQELDLPFIAVIPYRVQADKNLSAAAKLFFGQIVGLSRKFGYIFATDEQLSKMTDEPLRNIERWLADLEKSGYIRRETFQHFTENSEGKKHFIKKRKIFVNEAFCNEIPKKLSISQSESKDSNNVYGTAIFGGSNEPAKNGGSNEPAKNGGSNKPAKNGGYKKNTLKEHKKQQQPAPSAV